MKKLIVSLALALILSPGIALADFETNLTVGSRGTDVAVLQVFLNGLGSTLPITGYFGPLTRAELAKFQARENISPAVGYFGPLTRSRVNAYLNPKVSVTPLQPAPVTPIPPTPLPLPTPSFALPQPNEVTQVPPLAFVSGPFAFIARDKDGIFYISDIVWESNRTAQVISSPLQLDAGGNFGIEDQQTYSWRARFQHYRSLCTPVPAGSLQVNTVYTCKFAIQATDGGTGEILSAEVSFFTGI